MWTLQKIHDSTLWQVQMHPAVHCSASHSWTQSSEQLAAGKPWTVGPPFERNKNV